MSNELLQKVVNDTEGNGDKKGGYLAPAQVRQFFDMMYDVTVLGPQVRVERIRGDIAELTRMGIGERLLRVATEAVDDGMNVGAAFSKISLSTTKFRLDWEISTEALEDGLEGAALEDHIARLMATQVGNDMEDYAINASSTNTTDPGIGAFDGWSARANKIGHIVDAGGETLGRSVFSDMLKAMPRRARQNRANLKFFTSANAIQDFLDSEAAIELENGNTERSAASILSGPLGYTAPRIYGQSVQEVPLFDENKTGTYSGGASAQAVHSEVWLTDPKNLIWAVKREVQVYRQFAQKKDSWEYTLFTRFGTAIEDGNSIVVAKNVRTS
jgi:hypothetical protein